VGGTNQLRAELGEKWRIKELGNRKEGLVVELG